MWSRIKNFLASWFYHKSIPVSKPVPEMHGWQAEWEDYAAAFFKENLGMFNRAADITKLRDDYFLLSPEQQIKCLCTFLKGIVYYESGFNSKDASVDVGSASDKNTWSVGLMQVSVVDQANYKLNYKLTYDDLLQALPNLRLGLNILLAQVKRKEKLFIPAGESGVYWATIHPGGKYDESDAITRMVKQLSFDSHHDENTEAHEAPWYSVALGELGQNETNNPLRVGMYHSATDLDKADQVATTAWCASFVGWCLKKSGFSSTGTAWARDYLDYGTKLTLPKQYCIMVFERNSPGGDSHVTFWTGQETATAYVCLGGNQDDSVKTKAYARKDLLGCRWPA